MIELTTGNLLETKADALVNTVNCVGVMGKGIALQFKQAFPAMFKAYRKAAQAGEVIPGRMHVFHTASLLPPKFIINFPTKRHWRGRSRMEDIDAGLVDLIRQVRLLGIHSIAVPPLGTGNGGLEWAEVYPRIQRAFEALPDVDVLLFPPMGEPTPMARKRAPEKVRLTTARALFLKLLGLYRIPDYSLTMLEIQKLAYFLQEAGQPLRLHFVAHHYGPYAHNLNHVLRRLEGHYLHGATDVNPNTEITLAEGAIAAADAFLEGDDASRFNLNRVANLIEGYETPYGLELLSTVHWVARDAGPARTDPDACVRQVHAWNDRKRALLRSDHVKIAWRHLHQQAWLANAALS